MGDRVQILCVDDERNVLRAIERIFIDDDFDIITVGSGEEGLAALDENPGVTLVISDYRMPGMNGVEFLKEVCVRRPDTVRIVLSGYADTAAVVSAINEGQIYKFIPKPWNDDELRQTVIKAIETCELQNRNRELAEQVSAVNATLQRMNDELERLVAMRTAELTMQNRALSHSLNILNNLPVGVLVVVADGVVVQANKEVENLLGIPVESILSEKYPLVLPESVASCVDLLTARESVLLSCITINGRLLQIHGRQLEEDEQKAVIIVIEQQCTEEGLHA